MRKIDPKRKAVGQVQTKRKRKKDEEKKRKYGK